MCAPRVTRHTSIRYSTWVHRYSSLLQWSVPLGQRGHVGGSFAYFARNARCTVTTDLLVWYSNTQNGFSPGAANFSLHTLASPSGRNVNYDEKQLTGKKIFELFYLYRFCKYMSLGFPIINVCNPGVHYETPGICHCFYTLSRLVSVRVLCLSYSFLPHFFRPHFFIGVGSN